MIHSAEWTEEMKRQFLGTDSPTHQVGDLLRTCGFGVPSLERALYCASNSLTLISEAEIQPFDKKNGTYVTRDMHLYDLPWPWEILLDLAETEVKMHATLSYFVETGPGEVGWGNRYRYPSHGLRFDLNGPSESEEEFIHRINRQVRDEEESIETTGPGLYWTIGPNNRKAGSIHSDTWIGTAADLSQSNLIAIYPTTGWWRTRHHLKDGIKKPVTACWLPSKLLKLNTTSTWQWPPKSVSQYRYLIIRQGLFEAVDSIFLTGRTRR